MKVIYANTVSEALAQGLRHLQDYGVRAESRNGTVLVSPVPVTTVYRHPCRRVLFGPSRDANPFFHLMEALWMLHGDNDLAWPLYFNSGFANYSDDGVTINGAYGWRWREEFAIKGETVLIPTTDQLDVIAQGLRNNPSCRRQVLSMWAADSDLGSSSKDIPCNTHAYFLVDEENSALNMTVCNRSNDIIWGAYGANAVHFSMLLEYMADKVGLEVGKYYQVSNNYHLYEKVLADKEWSIGGLADEAMGFDYYQVAIGFDYYQVNGLKAEESPLVQENESFSDFDNDLVKFMVTARAKDSLTGADPALRESFSTVFFQFTVWPMWCAFNAHKLGETGAALAILDNYTHPHSDWATAATDWLTRRLK